MLNEPVDIAQKALALLNAKPIQSLDEDSRRAQICNEFYDMVKKDALSRHYWNFATKYAQLNRLAQEPEIAYDYQFDLPNDRVTQGPIQVFSQPDTNNPIQSWKIVDEKLMTDRKEIYIEYIADVDEHKFPAYFSRYLYHALAAEIAVSITDQVNMAQGFDQKAEKLMYEAKVRDSQEQSTSSIDSSPIHDARFGD